MGPGAAQQQHHAAAPLMRAYPLVVKLEPALAVRADEGVVVPAVHAAAVHQHGVQGVQVAHAAVRVLAQQPPLPAVQVQLVGELVPVVDLRSAAHAARPLRTTLQGCGVVVFV